MKTSLHFVIAAILAAAWITVPAASTAEEKRIEQLKQDFLKLKFGMFLHYNIATYTGEQWVVGYPDPSTFDPGGPIDTDQWADAAKAAGMKYAVLTAKHVSGFCLWDSKHTTYDVMHPDCPVQEDIVAKFIKSFTSRGLKVGLYYHWRHPGFGDPNKHKVLAPECDPAKHDLAAQKEFQLKQIGELLEKYPQCFYFWNEGVRGYPAAKGVVERLSAINSRNANYLLNVPPNKQGKLDEGAVKVLEEVGKLRAGEQ